MSSMINEELKSVEKENVINKLRETERSLKEGMNKNKGIVKEIFGIISFSLFTFVILGIVSLIDGKYDITKLGDLDFWGNWALVQIASVLAKIYATLFSKRRQTLTNPTFLHLERKIQNYIEKDSEDPFIENYATIDTKERKIHSFTITKKIEILQISKKYEITNSLEYLKNFDDDNLKISDLEPFKLKTSITYPNTKKQARWFLKQAKISDKLNAIFITLSKEWLDKNLDTQKVKYNKVTKSLLVGGYDNESNDKIGYTYKATPTKSFIKTNMSMFFFSAIFLILIRPILGSGFVKDASAWLNFVTNVFLVIMSFILSLYNAPQLFKSDILQPLIERETTLSEYYNRNKRDKNNIKRDL